MHDVIIVLCTAHHSYTHAMLSRGHGLDVRVMAYHQAWRKARLPRATYVFTDTDRLGFWELELAARLYRALAAGGAKVLNDPARAMSRVTLLRTLRREGGNHFDAWRIEDAPENLPFPVFLRTDSAHRGVISELLDSWPAVHQAVQMACGQGIPRRELILVQYRGEPVREGLYHKRAMFRIGSRMVPSLGVFESHWCSKRGELGIAGEALYAAEQAALQGMSDADTVRRAFELAHLDYGRADYGVVDGQIEIYEINTNPTLPGSTDHPFESRRQAGQMVVTRIIDAFRALDEPLERGSIGLTDKRLARQRKRDRWMTASRWIP
jgi:hypothetical protein